MQEFSSISVSSYEAGSLAGRLTEQSREGWSVVAIVPTGSTVTAYLCREASESDTAATGPAVAEPAPEATITEPAASQPAAAVTPPAPEPAAPEPAPAATSTVAAEPQAATAAAPAGWYADPSGRFELRYWDGSQWTEHVSRAGQQYTDPPVA